MKEPGVERPKGINGKTAGNADNAIFFLDKIIGIGGAFLKEKIVALFDIVRYLSLINNLFLPDIGIFITSATEHILVVIYAENADWAEVIAGPALKFLFINNLGGKYLIKIVGSLRQKAFC